MDAQPAADRFATIILAALDGAWEPLRVRLVGLTDDEYGWCPAASCWTVRERDGGWFADWTDPDPIPAPVTTLAWRCWHIAVDALDSYSSRLFSATGTGLSGTAWVADAASAIDAMDASWAVFRSGVAGWSEPEHLAPLGPDWGPYASSSHADLALHALREVVHHGAEIALLRDLYAWRA